MLKQYRIGLLGQKGSGKSFIANNIKGVHYLDKRNVEVISFASPIKDMTVAFLSSFLNDTKAKLYTYDPAYKELTIPGLEVSARHIMQTLGTEWGRELIGEDVWRNILREKAESLFFDEDKTVVCDDVRFTDEASILMEDGWYLTRVVAPGEKKNDTHASEVPADTPLDIIIINHKDGDVLTPGLYDLLMYSVTKSDLSRCTLVLNKGYIFKYNKINNKDVSYETLPDLLRGRNYVS